MNETQLIIQCQANDRAAQKELYHLHKDRLYTIAFRICNDFDAASDILQESFIDAFKSINKLNEPKYFYAWIKKMVIRKAYKYVTKKDHLVNIDEIDVNGIASTNSGSIDYIEKAIQSLPYKSRTVFVMAEIEGYSHKEIAEELDISVGTSKSQLNYAKTKLKNILSEYMEG